MCLLYAPNMESVTEVIYPSQEPELAARYLCPDADALLNRMRFSYRNFAVIRAREAGVLLQNRKMVRVPEGVGFC